MGSLTLFFVDITNFTSTSFEPTLRHDSKQIVAEGSPFQLTCLEPDSLPPAKKWWLNDVGHTISDSGKVRVDDDGRLIIDSAQLENAGNYSCVAQNIAGKTEMSVELIVTTRPRIISHPSSVTVDENEPSMLTCAYESSSEMYTVTKWRKDGKSLKHDYDELTTNRQQRIKIFKHNGTLLIHSTQTSDRGEYVCEVVTDGFEPVLSKPATISVIGKLDNRI